MSRRQNARNILNVLRCASAGFLAYNEALEQDKRRKWWVRTIFQDRDQHGFYETTFKQMKEQDEEMFIRATRMRVEEFNALFQLLEFRLQETSQRKPIPAECRLALTIIYLAHGGPRYTYAFKFKMSTVSVGRIIAETCKIIWDELSSFYLATPNAIDWYRIAGEYSQKWNFPHCLGALDGKHISIVCLPNAGSQFYNYKGRHSIVLLAACDANYCFTMVDIGAFGSQSDGGILANTTFWKLLSQGRLPIPCPDLLEGSNEEFPYFFIGDSAFPLGENLMRPFAGKNLPREEENFNKRLSQARVVIENTFGIMSARWRVLLNSIHALPENVDKIVRATVVLHNFLMKKKCASYCPTNYVDSMENGELQPGRWRNDTNNSLFECIAPSRNHNATREAYKLRKTLSTHLLEH